MVKRLRLFGLVSVIFFAVSGGPYGLEPLVGAVGARWAVGLIVLVPLIWSLPISLMVAELAAAIPAEGGYYVWVRECLGNFWGLQEGWWTICYTAINMAIYPVLFVDYLTFFLPQLAATSGLTPWNQFWIFICRWLIAVLLIVLGLALNWKGARTVGQNASLALLLVLAPFGILVITSSFRINAMASAFRAISDDVRQQYLPGLFALGLATALWNYCGWDNVSTFAGEVEEPRKNYPRALLITLPLTVAIYLFPVLAGVSVTTDAAVWSETAGWPVLGQLIGGSWLGTILALAALVSTWSLFNTQVLYVSRLPFVMARDGWLPSYLARVSKRTGVPSGSLLTTCGMGCILAALPFGRLVVIYVLLYSGALALEFAALIALRRNRDVKMSAFRIPGGWVGILLVTVAPMGLALFVAKITFSDESNSLQQILITAFMMISGVALYYFRRGTVLRRGH